MVLMKEYVRFRLLRKVGAIKMNEAKREMTRDELIANQNKYIDEIAKSKVKCEELYNDLVHYRNGRERDYKKIKELQSTLSEKDARIAELESVVDKVLQENNELQCKIQEPCNAYDEQSHFIYENQLSTTIDILVDRLAQLRKQKGLS